MDTNRLKQFCMIVETGNLRKAAQLMGISHSGLSKSMKAFEAEIGYPLLQPSGRGIVISDLGKRLYERSPSFFSELSQLLGHSLSVNPLVIRIGSFEVFTTYFMGSLLTDFLTDSEVEVHELIPGRLEEALLLNKIDLGITYEPIPRPGIEYVKVNQIAMGGYKVEKSFEGLSALETPFVVPVSPLEGAPSGVRGRDGWPDEKFKRKIRFRVDLMTTGIELVKRGLCAIFIPNFVAHLYNKTAAPGYNLVPVDLPKGMLSIKRNIYLVKRESTVEDRVTKQVARALRSIV